MDKHIELFCKQNPKFKLYCGDPNCKKEHTFDSKDVFKNKSFSFKCVSCGKSTQVENEKFIRDYVAQLKKLGVC